LRPSAKLDTSADGRWRHRSCAEYLVEGNHPVAVVEEQATEDLMVPVAEAGAQEFPVARGFASAGPICMSSA